MDYLKGVRRDREAREKREKQAQKKRFEETSALLQKTEEERQRKQRELAVQMSEFNRQMAQAKQRKMEADFRAELERDADTLRRVADERKDFFRYAETCIRSWKQGGQNVVPLLLEMKKYKDFAVQEGREAAAQ